MSTIPSIWESNLDVGSLNLRLGTEIIAPATEIKGSYVSLLDPTTHPTYGVVVSFRSVQASSTATAMLVDIAFGPTGGGSEEIIIPNLQAYGAPDANVAGSKTYHFPGLCINQPAVLGKHLFLMRMISA